MNYKPYAALPVGAICRDLDHNTLLLMKTDVKDRAMVLESVWIDNKLYPRGTLVEMSHNECVIALEDDSTLAVPVVRKDPIDPRRKFWTPGDTRSVCRELPAKVNLFAGLFLYSGFGMGNYYSGVDNEVLWCGQDAAEKHAAAEGIPFVYFDSFSWTKDPDLQHEKDQARKRFDDRAAKAADGSLVAQPTAAA